MKVRFKKLVPEAVTPVYAKDGDACVDLVAVSKELDDHANIVYGTGLALEIPDGYVGLVFPRSSNSKKDVWLTNHVGVIDSGYRGEVKLKYRNAFNSMTSYMHSHTDKEAVKRIEERFEYKVGDRIGQLMILPYPHIEFEEADELSATERGEGGFGSTGK